MQQLAIAISSESQPLVRTVYARTRRLIYLANPEYEQAIRAGITDPLGFPAEDVFEYDPDIYREMEAAWRNGKPVRHSGLRPLNP